MAPRWSRPSTEAKTTNFFSRHPRTVKFHAQSLASGSPELEKSQAAELASHFSKGFGVESFLPADGNTSRVRNDRPETIVPNPIVLKMIAPPRLPGGTQVMPLQSNPRTRTVPAHRSPLRGRVNACVSRSRG